MSNLVQFVGGQRRITQIYGSAAAQPGVAGDLGVETKAVAEGSGLKTILSVANGAGAVNVAVLSPVFEGASTTLRIRITLDGIVVVDRTVTSGGRFSLVGIGFPLNVSGEMSGVAPQRSQFNASCLVEASAVGTGSANGARFYLGWESYE